MVNFICGCRSKIDPPITEEIFNTFDSVVYDHEGFIMCLVHRERRTGWLSVPYAATKQPKVLLRDGEPEPVEVQVFNYTPLEFERLLIFGEVAPNKSVNFKSGAPDLRDNRDPAMLTTIGAHGVPVAIPEMFAGDYEVDETIYSSADPRKLLFYHQRLALESLRV